MKFISYSMVSGLSALVGLMIIKTISPTLLAIAILAVVGNMLLHPPSAGGFSMAAYMAILPLLLLCAFDCDRLREILVGFSFMAAIGRLACLGPGCCSGKESSFGITYDGTSVPCRHTGKNPVTVLPTVPLEAALQALIGYVTMVSKYGLVLFGLMNALLIHMTNAWRMRTRMGDNWSVPILALMAFSVLAYIKCPPFKTPYKISLQLKPWMVGVALAVFLLIKFSLHKIISLLRG